MSSSLEILKPKSTIKTVRTSPSSEAHLIELGRLFVELANKRDFTDPHWRNHMDPDFKTYTHAVEDISSRDEYIARFKAFTAINPNNFFEIFNISADVDERQGTATVWMWLGATAQPNNIQGERVNATYFRWRSGQGRWVAFKGTQVPGIGMDY